MGLTTSQGINLKLSGQRIEFAADETVRPVAPRRYGLLKESDGATAVGPTQENNPASDKVAWCRGGTSLTWWCGLNALKVAQTVCGDKSFGMTVHLGGAMKMVTPPDLGLPKMVEALDFGLETSFARRREYWDYAKTQAEMDDPAEFANGSMGTLEASIVVELSIKRAAVFSPMLRQNREQTGRAPSLGWPRLSQAAVEGNGIKYIDGGTPCDDQTLDKIESLEFDAATRQIRQIPTWRRWHLSLSTTIFEQPTPSQDPLDGTSARRENTLGFKLAPDGDGTALAQGAMLLEPAAQRYNPAFHARRGTVERTHGSADTISPIDSIQAASSGPVKPPMGRAKTDSKTQGHRTKRSATAQRRDYQSPFSSNFFSRIGQRAPKWPHRPECFT